MLFSFWRYQVILLLLFIFWSQFFTDEAMANQLVFNFAVFYPVGFLGGYRKENKFSLFGAVLIFNSLTYLFVFLTGGRIEDWLIVPIDFSSLAIFTGIGYFIGNFMSKTE